MPEKTGIPTYFCSEIKTWDVNYKFCLWLKFLFTEQQIEFCIIAD